MKLNKGLNYWIAGFIAGEAYFGFTGGKGVKRDVCQFAIVLKNNDVETLKMIQNVLGGTIFEQKSRDVFHYRIQSKSELANLITFCEKYMFDCYKNKQFKKWKEKVELSGFLNYVCK